MPSSDDPQGEQPGPSFCADPSWDARHRSASNQSVSPQNARKNPPLFPLSLISDLGT